MEEESEGREGGREEGKDGRREGGREIGRGEGGREGGREGGKEKVGRGEKKEGYSSVHGSWHCLPRLGCTPS